MGFGYQPGKGYELTPNAMDTSSIQLTAWSGAPWCDGHSWIVDEKKILMKEVILVELF